jgi:hypothetical protein
MRPLTRRTAILGTLATAAAPPLRLPPTAQACLVPVELDGKPAILLLDTGAERTILSRAAVQRLGLRRDPWVSTTLRGAGGLLDRRANADVRSARAGTTELFQGLPGKTLSFPVTTADLQGADGLLGGDILRHQIIDLDMPHGALTLRTPPEPPQSTPIPLQMLDQFLPLAQVHLDGHALTALIDTGASTSLLNARGLYRMGMIGAQNPPPPAVSLHAIGGNSPATPHRFKELSIGAKVWQSPILLTETVPEAAFDMILGLDLLGQQRLILSYPSQTLQFLPA